MHAKIKAQLLVEKSWLKQAAFDNKSGPTTKPCFKIEGLAKSVSAKHSRFPVRECFDTRQSF